MADKRYHVVLLREAEKQYASLPSFIKMHIADTIDALSVNPYDSSLSIKKLQKPLEGYRIRKGDYRILYSIESHIVTVYSILHRKDAYR